MLGCQPDSTLVAMALRTARRPAGAARRRGRRRGATSVASSASSSTVTSAIQPFRRFIPPAFLPNLPPTWASFSLCRTRAQQTFCSYLRVAMAHLHKGCARLPAGQTLFAQQDGSPDGGARAGWWAMLTIAKLSRWSVNYYNDTARAAGQAAKDAQRAGGGLGSITASTTPAPPLGCVPATPVPRRNWWG